MTSVRRKLIVPLTIAASLLFGSMPGRASPATLSSAANENITSPTPQGVKSRTVAQAVVLVAKGIRVGNKHFGKLVLALKGPAGAAFLQHSAKIADVLDDIAKIPDLVLRVVEQKLFQILSANQGAFQIAPGFAKESSREIVAVIGALL